VTTSIVTTVDDAEAAWLEALLAPGTELVRALLHPQFVAVHSPVGVIHDAEQFLADVAGRPTARRIETLATTVRHFPGLATVSCLQEMHIPFVPDQPPFAIQAAVSRVWVRDGDRWQLAHLQMARRFPPA
jgi:Domain of unknown function (DUF4440)